MYSEIEKCLPAKLIESVVACYLSKERHNKNVIIRHSMYYLDIMLIQNIFKMLFVRQIGEHCCHTKKLRNCPPLPDRPKTYH